MGPNRFGPRNSWPFPWLQSIDQKRRMPRNQSASMTITVPNLSKTTPGEPMLEHAIRLRAHELYVQRGRAEGHAVDDWLASEAELLYGHSTSDSND
jgi:hypothetical protein